jgi:hypothetical protein
MRRRGTSLRRASRRQAWIVRSIVAGRSDFDASDSASRRPRAFSSGARGYATILKTRRPAGGVGEVSAAVLDPGSELGPHTPRTPDLRGFARGVSSRIAGPSPRREVASWSGNERNACAQQLSTTATTMAAQRAKDRACAKVEDVSINPQSICTGLLEMQVQLLRQSAGRRALLVVDVVSTKPLSFSCIIFFPLIVQMGRASWH